MPAVHAVPAVHDEPAVQVAPAVHAAPVASNCLPCRTVYVVHAGERHCSSSALHAVQAVHAVLGLAGQIQGAQLALHMLQGPVAAALPALADQAALLLHRQFFAMQDFSGCLVLASQWNLPPHSAGACGCLSSRLPLHQSAEQQYVEPNI